MNRQLHTFYQFILRSPDSVEPEQARLAPLLQNAIWAAVLSAGINFVGSLVVSANITRYAIIFVGCVVLALGTIVLLRKISFRMVAGSLVASGVVHDSRFVFYRRGAPVAGLPAVFRDLACCCCLSGEESPVRFHGRDNTCSSWTRIPRNE